MMTEMSATANRSVRRPALVRDPDDAVVAGVCAAFARWLGTDPILVRVGFAIVTVASFGAGLLGYAVAWLAIPASAADGKRPERTGVGANWRVAGGVALLTLSLLLILRELGIWWSRRRSCGH